MSRVDATLAHVELTGESIIGAGRVRGTEKTAYAIDPARNIDLEPGYGYGGRAEVDRAARLAATAFPVYRATTSERRARFLETIADNIEALGDALIERTVAESGLPESRVRGERARTTGQLRLFAQVLREGSYHGARIDPALPDRAPVPRPDVRQRKISVGPVAVFAASNFPLAFSVAGGDTASALAAGSPVIVKAHEAHPGTSEMVGIAIVQAVSECDMPEGTFSLLFGSGRTLGIELVTHPAVKAVGFTGSRSGGLALVAAAAARPEPIPVYAEMSSINPVFLLPAALADNPTSLATGFVGSLTLGSGQFCTNPGLVFAVDGPGLDEFVAAAAAAVQAAHPTTMLSPGIAQAYRDGVAAVGAADGVEVLARGPETANPSACRAALFTVDLDAFLTGDAVQQEVFGASSVIVRVPHTAMLPRVVDALEGQLTATIHATDADHGPARDLLAALEPKVGRILFNGWPTGVEVGHAMVHGGPFPATSNAATTSVGSLAIERFLRPVAYQDVPAALLPSVLADGNPEGIWRRVDGSLDKH